MAVGEVFQSFEGWLGAGGLMLVGYAAKWLYDTANSRRKDSLGEWQAIAAKAEAERDECVKDARTDTEKAEKRYDDLHAQYVREQLDGQLLRGQNKLLQTTIDALRAGVDAAFLPGGAPPAWVTIDDFGTIIRVGPYVFPIVHYDDEELIGRPARMLVPPDHRAEHDAWLVAARDPASAIDSHQVYPRKAMTKQGEVVPVFMRLQRYSEKGRFFYNVLFWERLDGHSQDDIPVTITVTPVVPAPAQVPAPAPPA